MSIRETISTLGSLSTIDAQIAALDAELVLAREALDEKSALKAGLDARIERLSESVSAMEGTRSELVQEMRQTSLQVDRSREKMMRCRNEREANAVQRELEELRRVFREREHETGKLAGLIDAARSDLETAKEERDAIASELDATQGEATTKIRSLEAAIGERQTERRQASEAVDKVLFRRYEAVRQRRGSGLANAKDGMCVACHIALPPMLYQKILHETELFQCPSCQRILVPPGLALADELTVGDEGAEDASSESGSESGESGEGAEPAEGDALASDDES